MTAARVLRQILVFTCVASAFSESPCGTPAPVAPTATEAPGPSDAVLGGAIAGGVAAATALGVGVGVGVTDAQKKEAAAAAAAAVPNLKARVGGTPKCSDDFVATTQDAKAEAASIEVGCVEGMLAVGDNIKIGSDDKKSIEYNKVKSMSPAKGDETGNVLVLEQPLAKDHSKATLVAKVAASEVPAAGSLGLSRQTLGLLLVGALLLICCAAMAFCFCGGKKKKRAKKSAQKKAPVAPLPEVEAEVAPLLPLLAPATTYQFAQAAMPVTTSYAAPVTTAYAAPVTTATEYVQAAPVFAQAAATEYVQSRAVEYVQAPQAIAQVAMPVTTSFAAPASYQVTTGFAAAAPASYQQYAMPASYQYAAPAVAFETVAFQ